MGKTKALNLRDNMEKETNEFQKHAREQIAEKLRFEALEESMAHFFGYMARVENQMRLLHAYMKRVGRTPLNAQTRREMVFSLITWHKKLGTKDSEICKIVHEKYLLCPRTRFYDYLKEWDKTCESLDKKGK